MNTKSQLATADDEGRRLFFSSKTYDHNVGLSTAFRQWRAPSHCRFLHGYALSFELQFAAYDLDHLNWVVDFGSLKSLKGILETNFDHKTLVASDDPHIEWFRQGQTLGTLDLIEVNATGCEQMARMVYDVADIWLHDAGYSPRVFMWSVWVREHSGNGGGFTRKMLVAD